MSAILESPQRLIAIIGIFVPILSGVVIAALIVHYLAFKIINRTNQSIPTPVGVPQGALTPLLIEAGRQPVRWIMLVIATRLVIPIIGIADMPDDTANTVAHIFTLILIGLLSWLVIKTTNLLQDCVVSRFSIEQKDNLRARKIRTQLNVLRRIVIIVVSILALGTMLMTFPKVRQLGTTILASAGVIGIVVGIPIYRERTIGTFIAGPKKIDNTDYLLSRFIGTRHRIYLSRFIGTVGVDTIRQQLQKILNETQLRDKKVCVLQVTSTIPTGSGMELRALVSAADASAAWELRCYVREKLIEFIREKYPQALPKLRAELHQIKPEQAAQ